MARRRRTLEETSALNAQRFNTQQRERLPLFMQAGLEEDLLARGVLRDRPADHLARVHRAYVARLGRGDPAVWDRSARLQRAFKAHCPSQYAAELLRWRGMRVRFASLRRTSRPCVTCGQWMSGWRGRRRWARTTRGWNRDEPGQ